ncbi:MAG: ABC transporter permease [Oscillospiraceae bacterium]|nr:ABC transporter permease [Oscillospiraceae bacterium]
MKHTFFPKLAWSGIRKNRKLYLPYILTCMGMVMMFYILQSLSYSPMLHAMRGGRNMEFILSLGKFVIAVFAMIFLLYTNSFLIRRRNKEFGLYNILGMDKGAICRVVAWESLMVTAMGLAGGLFFGILLSKVAELGMLNVLHLGIDFTLRLSGEAIAVTLGIFAVIFLVLFLKSILQVRLSKPLELLHSENLGEKPPKANWALALLGLGLLVGAYFLAITTREAMTALTMFFVAVIMVIVGTYLLFIAGSVALCRILQKKKGYYYQKSHFVSVSSMVFRMKRNGAGLASICILLTMVLVMISSTTSLYVGSEDAMNSHYPRENQLTIYPSTLEDMGNEALSPYRQAMEQVFDDHGVSPENLLDFRYCAIAGQVSGDTVNLAVDQDNFNVSDMSTIRSLFFISQGDYNAVSGEKVSLEPGHALLYASRCTYDQPRLEVGDLSLTIDGTFVPFSGICGTTMSSQPAFLLVIPDYETLSPLEGLVDYNDMEMLNTLWYYGYDLSVSLDEANTILGQQGEAIHQTDPGSHIEAYSYVNRSEQRYDYYSTFGGLFFIGIMLSIVFLAAAVLIIYYKQLSEGYEDQSRFAIMKKVGMTSQDIRKSINSQILTVFFAPLIFAGLHQAFAFPMVWQLLQLFSLDNLPLVIGTTVGAFLLCGVFYAIVYKVTAGAYFSIVNDREQAV